MTILSAAQNIVNKIYALRKTQETRYPSERRIPYTGRTQAGVYITPDRALMNDTVWACHKYVTESCGQLPARVIKKLPNGEQELITSHPVDTVLNWRVNPNMSPFQFRETMVGWAIIHGNAVAEIERNGFGSVVNLWPLDPHRVTFLRDVDTGELVYEINQNLDGGKIQLRSQDIFHLRGFGNGDVGLSVVEYAAQTIGWAQATMLFGAAFFGNGMNFGGTIISEDKLDTDSANRIREELNETFGGPQRSNKWFIGDQGLKVTKTTATPDEAQFVGTLQHQIEAIARFFAVPVHKIGHLIRMTFNNVEQLSIDAVGQCIVPWAIRLQEEATYKLFGGNRQRLSVVFDMKGLLRGDMKSRSESLAIQFEHGIINGNFWADVEDQPRPKDGDKYWVMGNNLMPVERALNPPAPTQSNTSPKETMPNENDNMVALFALAEAETLLNEYVTHG